MRKAALGSVAAPLCAPLCAWRRRVRCVPIAAAAAPTLVSARRALTAAPAAPSAAAEAKARAALEKGSVNFHLTRKCNFACEFCFHTEKTGGHLPESKLRAVVDALADAGVDKLNVAGGEPLLFPEATSTVIQHAKTKHGMYTSIITNGSKLEDAWLSDIAAHLDMLGVSFDSSVDATNYAHGRWPRGARPPRDAEASRSEKILLKAAELAAKFGLCFKINTVVTNKNHLELLAPIINRVRPMRWKIFQVLEVAGENSGSGLRCVQPHLVNIADFLAFIERNRAALDDPGVLKVEPNEIMRASYLLVDEKGRFLDASQGGKEASPSSILDVGAVRALAELFDRGAYFDEPSFCARDGDFYKGAASAPEVEVKFAPPAGLEARLLRLCAEPPQHKMIRDTYWDAPGHALTAKDHWLRERNGDWELKSPTPETTARAAGELRVDFYDEATAWPDIVRALARAGVALRPPLPPAAPAYVCLADAGLAPFVGVESARRSYKLTLAGHAVRVDIDTARFSVPGGGHGSAPGPAADAYEIGEVELVAARPGVAPRTAIKEALVELGVSADTPVRGKLLEFIFRRRQDHWRALAASGLLADKLGSSAPLA